MAKVAEEYRTLYELIWRMMLEKDKTNRISLGSDAVKEIERLQESALKAENAVNYLADKMIQASQKIQFAENWRECMYKALGKDLNKYVRIALLIQRKEEEGED